MCRSSLAHERQSIIQAARITDLEHELACLRANANASASAGAGASANSSANSSSSSRASSNGTGSPAAAGSGPVASSKKTAANSDAQAPTTQKGRWWALGWR